MKYLRGFVLFGLAGCTQAVNVPAIKPSADYSGLSEHERSQFDWAAVEMNIPTEVARSMRRWQLGNISLNMFRCDEPKDYYPADARMPGGLFSNLNIPEPLNQGVKVIFYVPKHVQERERYECAALDARGYSPVFLRSQVLRLPTLKFETFDQQLAAPSRGS